MKSMWVKQFRASGQSINALALGLLMASYATEDGTGIGTSPMALASMMGGCSVRTLNKYLNGLIADGWIRIARIEQGESYRLAVPRK